MTNEEQYLELVKELEHQRFADVLEGQPVRVVRTQPLNVEAFFSVEGKLIKIEPLYYRGANSIVSRAQKLERERLANLIRELRIEEKYVGIDSQGCSIMAPDLEGTLRELARRIEQP